MFDKIKKALREWNDEIINFGEKVNKFNKASTEVAQNIVTRTSNPPPPTRLKDTNDNGNMEDYMDLYENYLIEERENKTNDIQENKSLLALVNFTLSKLKEYKERLK